MKSKDLLSAMSYVDEKYIHEAEEKAPKKSLAPVFRYASAAACLAVVIAAISLFKPEIPVSPDRDPDYENEVNMGEFEPVGYTVSVELEQVRFNNVQEAIPVDPDDIQYEAEQYSYVKWDASTVLEYYETDFTPAYIPMEFVADDSNSGALVVIDNQGVVVNDTVKRQYISSDSSTDSQSGFTLSVSKLGMINELQYENPDAETTVIADTEVIFGCRTVQAEAVPYSVYTAEFMLNEIEYQVEAYQTSKEDFVKIVASIITGKEEIEFVTKENK